MKKPVVVVVCHDAGGAEVLSALVAANKQKCEWYVIGKNASPAQAIFLRKGLDGFWTTMEDVSSVSEIMRRISPDYLFHSTGWQVRIEKAFLEWAKEYEIISVAFLEHWVNYKERFGYPDKDWENNLPDWIAVGDQPALELAQSLSLPNLIYVKNYYFDEIRQYRTIFSSDSYKSVYSDLCLFVSEPISEGAYKLYGDKEYWEFSEIAAIKSILERFDLMKKKFGIKQFAIRLHPSENTSKYHSLLVNYSEILRIRSAYENPLTEDIASARLVLGFTSMALFNAYLMGKPVISFIPSMKLKCTVPIPSSCQVTDIDGLLNVDTPCESYAGLDERFSGGMSFDELLNFLNGEKKHENSGHD